MRLCAAADEQDAGNLGCYIAPAMAAAREAAVFAAEQVPTTEIYSATYDPEIHAFGGAGGAARLGGVDGRPSRALGIPSRGRLQCLRPLHAAVSGRLLTHRKSDAAHGPVNTPCGCGRGPLVVRLDLSVPIGDRASHHRSRTASCDPDRSDRRAPWLSSEDLVTTPEDMRFEVFEPGEQAQADWLPQPQAELLLNTSV